MSAPTAAPVCPECEASIALNNPMRGEIVTCSECGAELEVTAIDPVQIALAPMEQEDWGE